MALLPLACAAQTPDDRCPSGSAFNNGTKKIEREISEFRVRIAHGAEYNSGFDRCGFEVRDRTGRLVVRGEDAWVEALPEMYVLRIGTNDLVIETGSAAGPHCCYTYYIVTQLPAPHVGAKIESREPIEFIDYRGIELNDLVTCDASGFDYFDGLAAAYSPCPRVFMRFVRGKLTDIGSLFKGQYDQEIAQARARMKPDALQYFHSRNIYDDVEMASNVLQIVLAYLYSGREEQAWKELAAMWPPADLQRIKSEILKARAKGILRYTRE